MTGGEPLVRRGCTDLIGMLSALPGIEQVTLTTNGILLASCADELCRQGLHAVNISLDTLDPVKYAEITGFDRLSSVLEGIRAMEERRISVKINAVLQRGVNDMECIALAELAKNHKLDVRFIELMPIGYGKTLEPVSNPEILKRLRAHYGSERVSRIPVPTAMAPPAISGSTAFRAVSVLSAPFMGNSAAPATGSA